MGALISVLFQKPSLKVAGRRLFAFALVLGFVLAGCSVAEACPQCQKALAGSDGGVGGNIVRGYFWSILFMLSMPFVLFGSMFNLLLSARPEGPEQSGAGRGRRSRARTGWTVARIPRPPRRVLTTTAGLIFARLLADFIGAGRFIVRRGQIERRRVPKGIKAHP